MATSPPQPPTLQDIRRDFPFPWRTVVMPQAFPAAQVRVIDAQNKEVALFAMTRFLEIITEHLNKEVREQA